MTRGNSIKKRILGRTGLEVSELAIGGFFLSSTKALQDDVIDSVNHALSSGVNYIDTSPNYSDSEAVLGSVLRSATEPYILSTKFAQREGHPFDPRNKDTLWKSIETSLKLLQRDKIDILMVHEPDRPGQYDWWSDSDSYFGPVIEVLSDLKSQGVVRFTGLGGTTAYEMVHIVESGQFDVLLTAFNYNVLWREAEHSLLPAAKKQKMGVIVGSPLQQGALACEHDEVKHGAKWLNPVRRKQLLELYDFSREIEIPLAELGVRFPLANPDISTILVSTGKPEKMESNIASVERGPLPADIMQRLDDIAKMVPFRPYEEPFKMPFGATEYKGPGKAGR